MARMTLRRRDVLKVATSSAAAAAATKLAGRSAWASAPTRIVRDVCILGGGSAGTYTAVQLRNLGKSVVVLEKQGRLGGHAETLFINGVPINIGVQVFEGNNPLVTSYCSQLNVPLVAVPLGGGPSAANVDLRTGAPVAVNAPSPVALGTALGTYLQVLQTQFPYLDTGFNLPDPVPADLLLPFGDFVTKYGLDALMSTAFDFTQGVGDFFGDPAIYVLKNFSLSVAGALATSAFVAVPTGTASLYDAAAAFLGSDAVLNATIVGAVRGGQGVEVLAETPDGPVLVQAGKLVVAFPPTLVNLAALIPDALELSLFSRFRSNYYATSLVQVSGLPPGGVNNRAANTRDNLPPLPGLYGLQPTEVPNYFVALYGNTSWLPDDFVKADITASIERLATSGTFPGLTFGGFQAFSSHAPFEMMVAPSDIAGGFYTRLNALQGHNHTYYTGAAFQTNDSSLIWRFTQEILPQIAS
jgi:hypothetical protein